MYKFLLIIIILIIAVNSFGQPITKEDFLLKSKSLRRTGWTLFIAGTGLQVIALIFPKGEEKNPATPGTWFPYKNSELKIAMFMIGFLPDIISIPFFGAARKNFLKAAKLVFEMEKTGSFKKPSYVVNSFPALKIELNF